MRALRILPQPNDSTCGPTALHAVYDHLGMRMPLSRVIREVHQWRNGGTLAVFLGLHALKQGLKARIHSYNLRVFDPSWEGLPVAELQRKLAAQTKVKSSKKLQTTALAYHRFLRMGGEVDFRDLNAALLKDYFDQGLPVLTGLSGTYLYKSKREYTVSQERSVFDDIRGKPMGHFVVLCGMRGRQVLVADPYRENPYHQQFYKVDVGRVINSIMLGIVTYDANLLIVSKPAHA
jgi:hypothetical protein